MIRRETLVSAAIVVLALSVLGVGVYVSTQHRNDSCGSCGEEPLPDDVNDRTLVLRAQDSKNYSEMGWESAEEVAWLRWYKDKSDPVNTYLYARFVSSEYATKLLDECEVHNPNYAWCKAGMAQVYGEKGDYDTARRLAKEAEDLYPCAMITRVRRQAGNGVCDRGANPLWR